MSTPAIHLAPPVQPARTRQAPLPTAILASFGVEVRKLLSQTRLKVIFALVIIGPWAVELFISGQATLPTDTLFGREMKGSGYALPLMLLGFGGQWLLPVIVSLVGGDIFASENQHGTWKTIMTRSISRAPIFYGKVLAALAYSTLAIVALVASSIVAGLVVIGSGSLINLGGGTLNGGSALLVVIESWAVALSAVYAFTAMAIFFSILTRSSTLGVLLPIVIGFVMQIFGFIKGADQLRHILLSSVLVDWHGLADDPSYASTAWRGVIVSAVYIVVLLSAAFAIFRRRDITGG
jgi:ABC-2 type transport system permease protein